MDPCEHVCSIYKNPTQQFSQIIPFLVNGLIDNFKCVYVCDENTKEQVISEFKKTGFNIDKYLKTKQFELLTPADSYLKNGHFNPEYLYSIIRDFESKALASGYKGLYGTGEMTWVFHGENINQELIRYENELNNVLKDTRSMILCQYDESKFDHQILTDIIRTHKQIYLYGQLYENKYLFNDPVFFNNIAGSIPANDYETMVKIIIDG
jgi:hypothetical protein